MTVAEARDLFSRTVHDARMGCIDPRGISAAMERLSRMRDRLRGRERRQVELYLGLLEDEWLDLSAVVPTPDPASPLRLAQELLLETFEQGGSRSLRLSTARATLNRLAELAREANDAGQRTAIARLAEPVMLLIRKLERDQPAGVAR
jgi:hypothetical protein